MTFKLEINCDNAAFGDDLLETEIANILQIAVLKIEEGVKQSSLSDTNGNRVGSFTFKGKREE